MAGILTHRNMPKVNQVPLLPSLLGGPAPGETFFPMQDDVIHYAASRSRSSWPTASSGPSTPRPWSGSATPRPRRSPRSTRAALTPTNRRSSSAASCPARTERGNVEDGLAAADLRIDAAFRFAANHHNPIEALTTTAVWDGDQLTLYDSCQGIKAVQLTVAALLGCRRPRSAC